MIADSVKLSEEDIDLAFVEEYVSHIKGEQLLHPKEFKRRYLFSLLKYFHAEMGV